MLYTIDPRVRKSDNRLPLGGYPGIRGPAPSTGSYLLQISIALDQTEQELFPSAGTRRGSQAMAAYGLRCPEIWAFVLGSLLLG